MNPNQIFTREQIYRLRESRIAGSPPGRVRGKLALRYDDGAPGSEATVVDAQRP